MGNLIWFNLTYSKTLLLNKKMKLYLKLILHVNVLPTSIYTNYILLFYCTPNALHTKLKNTLYNFFNKFLLNAKMCLTPMALI